LTQSTLQTLGEANTLNALGKLQFAQANYEQALCFHQQALAIMQQINDLYSEAATWFYLGTTLTALEQPQNAIAAYQNARRLLTEIDLSDHVEWCDTAIRNLEAPAPPPATPASSEPPAIPLPQPQSSIAPRRTKTQIFLWLSLATLAIVCLLNGQWLIAPIALLLGLFLQRRAIG
jgi:tetratricopeptide (TPR) repeat protein